MLTGPKHSSRICSSPAPADHTPSEEDTNEGNHGISPTMMAAAEQAVRGADVRIYKYAFNCTAD